MDHFNNLKDKYIRVMLCYILVWEMFIGGLDKVGLAEDVTEFLESIGRVIFRGRVVGYEL